MFLLTNFCTWYKGWYLWYSLVNMFLCWRKSILINMFSCRRTSHLPYRLTLHMGRRKLWLNTQFVCISAYPILVECVTISLEASDLRRWRPLPYPHFVFIYFLFTWIRVLREVLFLKHGGAVTRVVHVFYENVRVKRVGLCVGLHMSSCMAKKYSLILKTSSVYQKTTRPAHALRPGP